MCFNQDHKNLLIHMLSISCHCGLLKRVARLLKEAAAEGDLKKKLNFCPWPYQRYYALFRVES